VCQRSGQEVIDTSYTISRFYRHCTAHDSDVKPAWCDFVAYAIVDGRLVNLFLAFLERDVLQGSCSLGREVTWEIGKMAKLTGA